MVCEGMIYVSTYSPEISNQRVNGQQMPGIKQTSTPNSKRKTVAFRLTRLCACFSFLFQNV